jgi:hypothetical protein
MLTNVTIPKGVLDEINSFMVISIRLPAASGKRLKRMANGHGWTASDASARLVEEDLRRSDFLLHRLSRFARGMACLLAGQVRITETHLRRTFRRNGKRLDGVDVWT